MPPSSSRAGRLIAAAGALAIAAATLTPIAGDPYHTSSLCIACGELGGVDLLLNILLFLPLGFGLALAGLPLRRCALVALAATLAIELLQMRLVAGRDASVGDLLANSLGGVLGAFIGRRWESAVRPNRTTARRLAAAAGACVIGVLGVTMWLLQPSVPYLRLWGQWTPHHRQFAPFEGTLIAATLNGRPITRDDEMRPLAPLRETLLHEDSRVEATVVGGAPTPRVAAIVRVANPLVEAFLVGQRGHDLLYRQRLRAADARLRTPTVLLPDAFPPAATATDTLRLSGGLRGGVLFAERAAAGGASMRREVPLSPALGWNLLVPMDYALGRRYRWASALWLAGLVFPLAYWSVAAGAAGAGGAGRFGSRWTLVPPVTLLVGLALPALVARAPAAHWSEWVAGATGIGFGMLAHAVVWRRRTDGDEGRATPRRPPANVRTEGELLDEAGEMLTKRGSSPGR